MLLSLASSSGEHIHCLKKNYYFSTFRVVGEEQEGWVKVQRISIGATTPGSSGELMAEEEEEGYIPIAFTEPV